MPQPVRSRWGESKVCGKQTVGSKTSIPHQIWCDAVLYGPWDVNGPTMWNGISFDRWKKIAKKELFVFDFFWVAYNGHLLLPNCPCQVSWSWPVAGPGYLWTLSRSRAGPQKVFSCFFTSFFNSHIVSSCTDYNNRHVIYCNSQFYMNFILK